MVDRIYFNAIFGGLGGLLGWMLFAVFGNKMSVEVESQQILGGGLVGGLIGYLVVSADAIRDRSWVRFCRLGTYGAVIGGIGGALGTWLGDRVYVWLSENPSPGQEGAVAAMRAVSRSLGWMFLGLAVGIGEGAAARSAGKLAACALGGALGGWLGGALFGLFFEGGANGHASHVWGQSLGLVILGACVGATSALMKTLFQSTSVGMGSGAAPTQLPALGEPERRPPS